MSIFIYFLDWTGRAVEDEARHRITQRELESSNEFQLTFPEGTSQIAVKVHLNRSIRTLITFSDISLRSSEVTVSLIDEDLVHRGYNRYSETRKFRFGSLPKKARGYNLIGRFFGFGDRQPEETMSVLQLDKFESYDAYLSEVKKRRKRGGALIPTKSKIYNTHPFHLHNHVIDYLDVNESADIRQGKPMSASYLRSHPRWQKPELLHPKIWKNERTPGQGLFDYVDDENWGIYYGVFLPEPGHLQGDLEVDERLVGYLFVARFGEAALYSYIIGHADHNKNGIMYRLHFDFVRKILDCKSDPYRGIKCLLYSGHYQGETESGIRMGGLMNWKEKLLFEPINLVTSIDEGVCDEDLLAIITKNVDPDNVGDRPHAEILRSKGLIS